MTRLIGLVSVAALFGACGDKSSNSNPDLATGPACPAGQKACVGDRVARLCPSDGSGWLALQCSAGTVCMNGDCVPDGQPVSCTAADNRCMSDTVALRCATAGAGWGSVTCPSGTHCTGPGLCEGSCVVGSSLCTSLGAIATCTDGKTFTVSSCGAGEFCVATGDAPIATAACKKGDCTPTTSGCDAVCGNQLDPAASAQETVLSTCVATPDGYQWRVTTCSTPQTCNPAGAVCGGGGAQAACKSDCTPGDQRCVSLAGATIVDHLTTGHQTCGADGHWAAAVSACNAVPTATGKVCFPSAAASNKVVCGDPACALDVGSCDAAGQFHACGADGTLAAIGVACQGVCLGSGPASSPGVDNLVATPGHCVAECEPGDERCTANYNSGSTYQACGADKKWGPVLSCTGMDRCLSTQNTAGRPRKVCGVCLPGDTRCSDMGGAASGPPSDYVQTCQANGAWGSATACAIGVCQSGADGKAACLAQCAPGDKVCVGAGKGVAGAVYQGTAEEGVCTAQGKLPASGTACAGAAVCRRGPNRGSGGRALGCTVCVGSANEFGLPDTRCTDMNGGPGSGYVQTCQADGSTWAAAPLACAAPNPACNDPSTNIPAPRSLEGVCQEINLGGLGMVPLSDSSFKALNPSDSCATLGYGSPVSCGLASGGHVADCCAFFCRKDPQPTSAYCGP